jgi:hypothetical protein
MATAKKQKGATKRSDATVVPRKKPVRLKAKTEAAKAQKLAHANAARDAAHRDVVESLSIRAPQVVAEDAELNAILSETNRPTTYTEALGTRISDLLVAGLSVMKIAKMPGMPSEVRMFRWIGTLDHPFSAIYKEAKALMVSRFEEEIQAIADEQTTSVLRIEREVFNPAGVKETVVETRHVDAVEHRKLRIAARQWSLSHLMPKKHGKQAQVTDDKPNEQLNALFAALKAGPADTNG